MACGEEGSSVLESRAYHGGRVVVRRRECCCGNRWTTEEKTRGGSNTLSVAGRYPSNSGSRGPSNPPVIAGQPTSNSGSPSRGGAGGALPSGPVLALSLIPPEPSKPDLLGLNIMSVYAHYRRHHPRAAALLKSTSKEWRAIRDRLDEGSSANDLCQAIDGYHLDPWHRGENDRRKPFLKLDMIMRDAGHVLSGIEMLTKPAPQPVSKNGEAVRAVLAMNGGKP